MPQYTLNDNIQGVLFFYYSQTNFMFGCDTLNQLKSGLKTKKNCQTHLHYHAACDGEEDGQEKGGR